MDTCTIYIYIHTIACTRVYIHTLTHFLCLTGCRLHQVLEQGNQERRGETVLVVPMTVQVFVSTACFLNGCPNPQTREPGRTAEGELWVKLNHPRPPPVRGKTLFHETHPGATKVGDHCLRASEATGCCPQPSASEVLPHCR